MSTPSISYLLLDAQNDPVFDPQVALAGSSAVAQAILTRLRLFLGEWWENQNLGVPMFQSILGQLASKSGQTAMSLILQQQVAGVPYVTQVQNVAVKYINGVLYWNAAAITVFGPVTVTNYPGSFAELDT